MSAGLAYVTAPTIVLTQGRCPIPASAQIPVNHEAVWPFFGMPGPTVNLPSQNLPKWGQGGPVINSTVLEFAMPLPFLAIQYLLLADSFVFTSHSAINENDHTFLGEVFITEIFHGRSSNVNSKRKCKDILHFYLHMRSINAVPLFPPPPKAS